MESRTYQIKAEASRFHCNPDDEAEELEVIVTCEEALNKAQAARIICAIHSGHNLKQVSVTRID